MEKLALWEERLPKPVRLALGLGRIVAGARGLEMLYALGIGILPAIAVVLADIPLSAKILGGTSAFLVGTASVGQTIAWWKRRHHLKVAWEAETVLLAESPEARHRLLLRVTNNGHSDSFRAKVVAINGLASPLPTVPWVMPWRDCTEEWRQIGAGDPDILTLGEVEPMGDLPRDGHRLGRFEFWAFQLTHEAWLPCKLADLYRQVVRVRIRLTAQSTRNSVTQDVWIRIDNVKNLVPTIYLKPPEPTGNATALPDPLA